MNNRTVTIKLYKKYYQEAFNKPPEEVSQIYEELLGNMDKFYSDVDMCMKACAYRNVLEICDPKGHFNENDKIYYPRWGFIEWRSNEALENLVLQLCKVDGMESTGCVMYDDATRTGYKICFSCRVYKDNYFAASILLKHFINKAKNHDRWEIIDEKKYDDDKYQYISILYKPYNLTRDQWEQDLRNMEKIINRYFYNSQNY